MRIHNHLLITSANKDKTQITDFSSTTHLKVLKVLEPGFKCGGLNDCFDVDKSSSKVFGYDEFQKIKVLNLKQNFKESQFPVDSFTESFIFKVLPLKKVLIVCTRTKIIEIDLDTMKMVRNADLKTNGSILLEFSKNEDFLFITENKFVLYIVQYSNLKVVNKILVPSRFIALSFPKKSNFIYGILESSNLVFYGNPQQFLKGFKTSYKI